MRRLLKDLGLLSLAGFLLTVLAASDATAATITVTGTGDTVAIDGVVTLREAIQSINGGAPINGDVVATGAGYGTNDTINFNIAGAGVHTIAPASALPAIALPVTIDGYTQPGASPNIDPNGFNGTLLIELDGENAGPASGLHVTAGNSTVRGLVINRFILSGANDPEGNGIFLESLGGNHIEGNFLGTDPSGTLGRPNTNAGVFVRSPNNTIGGTSPGARNILSGNAPFDGVFVSAAFIPGLTDGTVIQGNFIGTQADGMTPLANTRNGVSISHASALATIGGTSVGASNRIAFNGGRGVEVDSTGTGNAVLSNSIFSNGSLGIDLNGDGSTPNDACDADTGPNNLQNYPILTTAFVPSPGSTTIQGTLNAAPNTVYRIELFSNATCDPSAHGEGQTYLGSTPLSTDGTCNGSFNVTFPVSLPPTARLTATATDPNNNTSEFSSCISLQAQFYTVTPCRVADTRRPNGPYGGPALDTTGDRSFVIASQCGIPLTAQAVTFNFAIVQPTGGGHIRVYPGGNPLPVVAAMNYSAGQIRANNAIVPLGPAGDILVHLGQGAGTTTNLVIDVTGYFQ